MRYSIRLDTWVCILSFAYFITAGGQKIPPLVNTCKTRKCTGFILQTRFFPCAYLLESTPFYLNMTDHMHDALMTNVMSKSFKEVRFIRHVSIIGAWIPCCMDQYNWPTSTENIDTFGVREMHGKQQQQQKANHREILLCWCRDWFVFYILPFCLTC